MVLVNAFRNFPSPYAAATKIFGIAIAFDEENVALHQCEAGNLIYRDINFLYFGKVDKAVLYVSHSHVWLFDTLPSTVRTL